MIHYIVVGPGYIGQFHDYCDAWEMARDVRGEVFNLWGLKQYIYGARV